jgi:hypothetical protein
MAEQLPDDYKFEDISRRSQKRDRDTEFNPFLDGKIWKVDVADYGFRGEDRLAAEHQFMMAMRTWLKRSNKDYRVHHGKWKDPTTHQEVRGTIVIKLVPFVRPVDPAAQNGQPGEQKAETNAGTTPAV